MKDFSMSQAVAHTVKVVTSRKRCKVETLLLQINNRKWSVAYQLVASPTSLNNPQDHAPNAAFKMRFLARLCTAVDDISTDTQRGAQSLRFLSWMSASIYGY